MRKDSQIFLKKILDYRNSTGENNFELNYKYFDDIPSVETAIYDILDDLISYNCLTSKSQVIDLEGNISINLTLDGITYFDDEKESKTGRFCRRRRKLWLWFLKRAGAGCFKSIGCAGSYRKILRQNLFPQRHQYWSAGDCL